MGEVSNSFARRLCASIHSFIRWLDRVGYESYDPYDLWGTRYGLFARRLYYEKNSFGLLLIAQDVPFLRRPVGRMTLYLLDRWKRFRQWWSKRQAARTRSG